MQYRFFLENGWAVKIYLIKTRAISIYTADNLLGW